MVEPLAQPAEAARVFEMFCYLCSTGWVLKPVPNRMERRNAIPPFTEDSLKECYALSSNVSA
eukprot:9336673-Prorocentrum_lima.AAC.1